MATVTGLTAARMLEIEGQSIVDARLENYDLILTTFGGQDINVGDVRGPQGIQGIVGPGTQTISLKDSTAPMTDYPTGNSAMIISGTPGGWPTTYAQVMTTRFNDYRCVQVVYKNSENGEFWVRTAATATTWGAFTAFHMFEATQSAKGLMSAADKTKLDGLYVSADFVPVTITTATDFDTLTEPGTYLFTQNTVVAACANKPDATDSGFTAGLAGFLVVEGNGSTLVKQSYTNYNNAAENLKRSRYNSTWYGWRLPIEGVTATQHGLMLKTDKDKLDKSTSGNTAGTLVERSPTSNNFQIGTPTDPAHAATKSYVDGLGYRYLQTVVFTASGTFSKASYPGLKGVRIRVVGGGGGGGRANAASTGNHSSGSGGGGGGYAEAFVLAANLATSETVTVGAGGAGGSSATNPANGLDGGTSSFGTKAVATGGGGGGIASNTSVMLAAVPAGIAGIGTTGEVKGAGGTGDFGVGNATLGIGGNGGSSIMGGGGAGGFTPAGSGVSYGADGSGYGGGGGGASANTAATGGNGAPGAPGVVIVEVYI